MMKVSKNVAFAALLLLACAAVKAQEKSDSTTTNKKVYNPFEANLQIRSLYLWRGFTVSSSPITDVDMHYISKDGTWKAGFWGGAGLDGVYKEFDYYVSYTKGNFGASIWDINNFTNFPDASLFDYDRRTTSHFIDVGVSYKVNMKLPLLISWNTIVQGRDIYTKASGKVGNDYSNYVQLDQTLWQQGNANLHVFVGGGFAFGQQQNFYGSKPNIVNSGFTYNKDLIIFKYHVPISATAMFSPEHKSGALQLIANIF